MQTQSLLGSAQLIGISVFEKAGVGVTSPGVPDLEIACKILHVVRVDAFLLRSSSVHICDPRSCLQVKFLSKSKLLSEFICSFKDFFVNCCC